MSVRRAEHAVEISFLTIPIGRSFMANAVATAVVMLLTAPTSLVGRGILAGVYGLALAILFLSRGFMVAAMSPGSRKIA